MEFVEVQCTWHSFSLHLPRLGLAGHFGRDGVRVAATEVEIPRGPALHSHITLAATLAFLGQQITVQEFWAKLAGTMAVVIPFHKRDIPRLPITANPCVG